MASVWTGEWERPEAFSEDAYVALIDPDMVAIPVYFAASVLLFLRKPAGVPLGLVTGGAVSYAMIYLLALSGFRGLPTLVADGVFLALTVGAILQLVRRCVPLGPARCRL